MGCSSLLNCPEDVLAIVWSYLLKPLKPRAFQTVARLQDDAYLHSPFHVPSGGRFHSLAALSSTCHALRVICVPIMFRSVYFNSGHRYPPPVTILAHIRTVRFYPVDHHTGYVVGYVARSLSQMPQLSRVVLEASHDDRVDRAIEHLAAVLAAPSLQCLTLRDVGLSSFGQPISPTPQLRSFRMCFRDRLRRLLDMSLDTVQTETSCLEAFLEPMRHQFEVLRLPGESTRLSFLVVSPWPRLRELTICGACPTRDAPLSQVLHAMPELRSFALAVAYHHSVTPPMLLPDTLALPPDVRHLRRFVMSFPHPDDGIFSALPSSLLELSLRDTPRHWSRILLWQDAVNAFFGSPLLTCQGALRIFSVLQGDSLERLELVVREDAFEEQMLKQVAVACPRLHFLELHRYRIAQESERRETPVSVPVTALASCLAAFHALRTLRLNLNFPLIFSGNTDIQNVNAIHEFVDEQAGIVAKTLPWLTSLSLFCCIAPMIQELHVYSPGLYAWRGYTLGAAGVAVLALDAPSENMRRDSPLL